MNLATNLSVLYLTLKTYFDPIAFRLGGSLLYTHVWWFSRFCSSFSIISYYWRPWIELWIALLYTFDICVLLLDSLINIITSYSFSSSVGSMLYVIFIAPGFWGVGCIDVRFFCDLSLSHGSPTGAFFFSNVHTFSGWFNSSFAFFSNSLIYGSLIIITCFICGAQTLKCLVVL